MKKYLLLLTITIGFLGGCKLDEAGFPKKDSSLLIGKWYSTSTTTYTPAQGTYPASSSTFTAFTTNDYLLFAPGILTQAEGFTDPTKATLTTFKYAYKGSTLTVTSNTDPSDIEMSTVSKLTADSLVLVSDATADNGGVIVTYQVIDRYAHK